MIGRASTVRARTAPAVLRSPTASSRCAKAAQLGSPARPACATREARCSAAAEAASTGAANLNKYETLIVLKPTLTDEERDQELARFESFLVSEDCEGVKASVRGRHRMAYPVKGNWEGIYVLFSFKAKASTTPKVQKLLSNPAAGAEDNILRHMTFRY